MFSDNEVGNRWSSPSRRRLLTTIGVGVIAVVGGCLDGAVGDADLPGSGADDEPSTDAPDEDEPGVASTSFERVRCAERGVSDATLDGDALTVSGCLEEFNGCRAAVLEGVATTGDTYRVTVGTESTDPDAAPQTCPQSQILTGYVLTIQFDEAPSAGVDIVHRDAHGEAVVARLNSS